MRWTRPFLVLALIALLIQPAAAQDDSGSSDETGVPVELPLEPAPPPAPIPTVAPSPTPLPGPPAPGTVLLSDNFDDPAAGRLPGSSPDPTHFELGYADGEYALNKVDPAFEGGPFVTLPGTYGNASLAVDARIVGDATNRSFSLYCRIQPTSRFAGYLLVVLPADGGFSLFRFDDGNRTALTDFLQSAVIRRGNEVNRVELRCAGPTISVTVNGTRLTAVADNTYQEGRMRVGATGVRSTVQARLDNLVVTQVAEEAPPAPGPYDGGWTGQTNQLRANSFTVRNNAIVSVDIDYFVEASLAGSYITGYGGANLSGHRTFSVSPPVPIDNDRFSVTISQDVTFRSTVPGDSSSSTGTVVITVTGRFNSPTRASGDTDVAVNIPGLGSAGTAHATWTATRN